MFLHYTSEIGVGTVAGVLGSPFACWGNVIIGRMITKCKEKALATT